MVQVKESEVPKAKKEGKKKGGSGNGGSGNGGNGSGVLAIPKETNPTAVAKVRPR